MHPVFLRSLHLAVIAYGSAALAQGAGRGEPPLTPFAAQRVVVMPIQFVRVDSASPVKPGEWTTLRKEIDDSIASAIGERGIGKKWAYAPEMARMGKRNAGYISDPYTLGAGGLRTRPLKADDQAPRMLIDNMRSIIALGDARYALVPVELAFSKLGEGSHAVLRLVMLDGRAGQIVWFGDLGVEPGKAFNSAAIGSMAQLVADLVAAR